MPPHHLKQTEHLTRGGGGGATLAARKRQPLHHRSHWVGGQAARLGLGLGLEGCLRFHRTAARRGASTARALCRAALCKTNPCKAAYNLRSGGRYHWGRPPRATDIGRKATVRDDRKSRAHLSQRWTELWQMASNLSGWLDIVLWLAVGAG